MRARKPALAVDERASSGRREVTQCLPLLGWRVEHVWQRIAAGAAADLVHPAYAAGMPRLSCTFCIFAPRAALVTAARLRPDLAHTYAELERVIGHSFKVDLTIAEVLAAAESGEAESVEPWIG